jgi:hypothetical protein
LLLRWSQKVNFLCICTLDVCWSIH